MNSYEADWHFYYLEKQALFAIRIFRYGNYFTKESKQKMTPTRVNDDVWLGLTSSLRDLVHRSFASRATESQKRQKQQVNSKIFLRIKSSFRGQSKGFQKIPRISECDFDMLLMDFWKLCGKRIFRLQMCQKIRKTNVR